MRTTMDGSRAACELRAQQALAHAMHADARERVGHGRERADNVVIAAAAHFVQREGAVLAARPGDQRLWLGPEHVSLRSIADARHAERHVLPPGCAAASAAAAFCFGAAAGASCLGTLDTTPSTRKAESAARSPDSQAPPTVPYNVSCAASPA